MRETNRTATQTRRKAASSWRISSRTCRRTCMFSNRRAIRGRRAASTRAFPLSATALRPTARRSSYRPRMDRSQCGGRTDDLGARRAENIVDKLVSEGGWYSRPGCTVLNLYRPPAIRPRRAVPPHGSITCEAFGEMPNTSCLVRSSRSAAAREDQSRDRPRWRPRIGKDCLLEPVKQAVGPWNSPRSRRAKCSGASTPF